MSSFYILCVYFFKVGSNDSYKMKRFFELNISTEEKAETDGAALKLTEYKDAEEIVSSASLNSVSFKAVDI